MTYNLNCTNSLQEKYMKGLILFLFLLAHTTMIWASPVETKNAIVDTSDVVILETDPTPNVEKYARKRKMFNDSLLNYLSKQCIETVLKIQDSVFVNFIVKGSGKVDSVWLVSPKDFPFEEIYKFIKNYDFKGSLVEYLSIPFQKHSFTVRIILIFDRKINKLGIYFDYTRRW